MTAFFAHAVTDEYLGTPGTSWPLPLPSQQEQPSAAVGQALDSSVKPGTYKLAALLLGYGRRPAVTWAQQLLGVQLLDGRAMFYLGDIAEWATDTDEERFGQEWWRMRLLGLAHHKDGQYAKAEALLRWVGERASLHGWVDRLHSTTFVGCSLFAAV